MVDFDKLLGKEKLGVTIDPIAIFDNLDKENGKEYLRPPQSSVLKEWHSKFRDQKDVIVKLHTGQGKTLIGLLMLQSFMSEGHGPGLYLCPNHFLVDQTTEQARTFGINTVTFPDSNRMPPDFLNSQAILVSTCNKLFNGKSVFGVQGSGREIISLGAVVLDDAHKCLDIMRDAFSIQIRAKKKDGSNNPLYKDLWGLFEESMTRQRAGTTSDIAHGADAFMAVPFWTWHQKRKNVLEILRQHKDNAELTYVWDLLKDNLERSICVFSGKRVEISPRILPLELVPSFLEARHRILLSATLTQDPILVRDLGIDSHCVSSPISSGDVQYSGERLILLPTLVDQTLTRERIIEWDSSLAKKHGSFGVVTITPSFLQANQWTKFGAKVTNVDNLETQIDQLKDEIKNRSAKQVVVLVNEYDGVDLPDSTCRILCLDSLPSYSSLIDAYVQDVRPTSKTLKRQLAQRVEQGMGRAIRGSSDWCIVIVAGNNLTSFMSEHSKRMYLSKEAQMQIWIGEELADEMRSEGTKLSVVEKLVTQVLDRNQKWKEYYRQKMSEIESEAPSKEDLERAVLERDAEQHYRKGQNHKALDALQELVNKSDQSDKGWYLQLKAVYLYPIDPTRSMDAQLKAYTENQRLFRPETGITYSKLVTGGGSQSSRVLDWLRGHETHNALVIDTMATMDKLVFSTPADTFEEGMDELGVALGLSTQRPERILGIGPDNLWRLKEKTFWIIECKNEVSLQRKEISKAESGQLSQHLGWFSENYEGSNGLPILVHPVETLAEDAFPPKPSWVLGPKSLDVLKQTVLTFCNSFREIPFDKLTQGLVKEKLEQNNLALDDLAKTYLRKLEK